MDSTVLTTSLRGLGGWAEDESLRPSLFSDADLRLFTLFDLFELNANHREPGDIEGISERLGSLSLLVHARVGFVDPGGPDFFPRLLERDHDVGAVHPLGRLPEQVPKLVAKGRNDIATGLLRSFLHGAILASTPQVDKANRRIRNSKPQIACSRRLPLANAFGVRSLDASEILKLTPILPYPSTRPEKLLRRDIDDLAFRHDGFGD